MTSDWGAERERVVRWHDPVASARRGLAMSGLAYLQAMADGELPPPPISGLILMSLDEVAVGRVSFTCRPDESTYNPIGSVHGGLVCTLLDSVCGCALHSTLPAGRGYTSVEIKVSYLRPVRADSGLLTATGTVTKTGARVAFTEGVVTDERGRPVATASSTLLVFDLPGSAPPSGSSRGPADG